MSQQLPIWDQWLRLPSILIIRYESLVADPIGELVRLAGFLSIDIPCEVLHQIVTSYQVNRVNENRSKHNILHFNKGVVGRYKSIMDPKELDLCRQHFGAYLQRMG